MKKKHLYHLKWSGEECTACGLDPKDVLCFSFDIFYKALGSKRCEACLEIWQPAGPFYFEQDHDACDGNYGVYNSQNERVAVAWLLEDAEVITAALNAMFR